MCRLYQREPHDAQTASAWAMGFQGYMLHGHPKLHPELPGHGTLSLLHDAVQVAWAMGFSSPRDCVTPPCFWGRGKKQKRRGEQWVKRSLKNTNKHSSHKPQVGHCCSTILQHDICSYTFIVLCFFQRQRIICIFLWQLHRPFNAN